MSQACASQLLSAHSLAGRQLGTIQYASCWQPSLVCDIVYEHVLCRGGGGEIMHTLLGLSLFCYIFPSTVPG